LFKSGICQQSFTKSVCKIVLNSVIYREVTREEQHESGTEEKSSPVKGDFQLDGIEQALA